MDSQSEGFNPGIRSERLLGMESGLAKARHPAVTASLSELPQRRLGIIWTKYLERWRRSSRSAGNPMFSETGPMVSSRLKISGEMDRAVFTSSRIPERSRQSLAPSRT